jgi:hypothetical protein
MPQIEDHRIKSILKVLFPDNKVPLDLADQVPSIKLEIGQLLSRVGILGETHIIRIGPTTEASRKLNERIKGLKDTGLNFVEIADKVNEEGHRTSVGNKFTSDSCRKRWVAYMAFLQSQKGQVEIAAQAGNLSDLDVPGYLSREQDPSPEPTPGPQLMTMSIPETLPEEPKADPEIIEALQGEDIQPAGITATELPPEEIKGECLVESCGFSQPQKKFGPGNPKIPLSEDELIYGLRQGGDTFRSISKLRQAKHLKYGLSTEPAGVPARDEAAINRTIRDMHERGKTDLEISVFLQNTVGGPWLPDEVARRLKGKEESK